MVAWYWILIALVVGIGCGYGFRGLIRHELGDAKDKANKILN